MSANGTCPSCRTHMEKPITERVEFVPEICPNCKTPFKLNVTKWPDS